jgi:two-component system, NarL family, nitrate/nitrite response regulator NarL
MPQPSAPSQGNSQKITVLAADSTRMSSQLLADALAQDDQFEVTSLEANSSTFLQAVADQRPNILLLSSAFNGSANAGFEITRRVRAASAGTRVIILMDATDPGSVIEAFRSGAQGIFSRAESAKALAKCIRSVHHGQVWANSAELRYLIQAFRESPQLRMVDSRGDAILSKREHDVVQCVAEGLSNREIAARLKLTEHTVKNYLFRIFDKLGVSSRVEVVLYAFSCRESGSESFSFAKNDSPAKTDRGKSAVAPEPESKKPADAVKPLARRARL